MKTSFGLRFIKKPKYYKTNLCAESIIERKKAAISAALECPRPNGTSARVK
ncbi:hypothetical protein SAMN05216524_10197 [Mucilaginibacter sp. OK098]|nr:hypothetical protein SAMN05216524_10197 [Mucilaginibacter sp. OK098]